jgi:hypothetical protein
VRRSALQPGSQRRGDLGKGASEIAAAGPLVGWPEAWRLGGATT